MKVFNFPPPGSGYIQLFPGPLINSFGPESLVFCSFRLPARGQQLGRNLRKKCKATPLIGKSKEIFDNPPAAPGGFNSCFHRSPLSGFFSSAVLPVPHPGPKWVKWPGILGFLGTQVGQKYKRKVADARRSAFATDLRQVSLTCRVEECPVTTEKPVRIGQPPVFWAVNCCCLATALYARGAPWAFPNLNRLNDWILGPASLTNSHQST